MFKLIASDLDGTLLKNDKTISPYSVSVLQEASQAGIPFIICTGRMYDSLKEILPALPFCRYAIASMGAEIYDNFAKKRIYSRPLEPEYAEILITYALKNNIHMHLYIDDILYTSALDQYSDLYFQNTTSMGRLIPGDIFAFIRDRDDRSAASGKAQYSLFRPHVFGICLLKGRQGYGAESPVRTAGCKNGRADRFRRQRKRYYHASEHRFFLRRGKRLGRGEKSSEYYCRKQ